jgi:hypothetical protein
MDQFHRYTLLHRTRYKSLPSPQGLAAGGFASFCTAVDVYGFKLSNVVSACTEDFEISVSWNYHLKHFLGDASYRTPISSHVSSEGTCRVCCRYLFNNEPKTLLEIHSIFDVSLISKEMKQWETFF